MRLDQDGAELFSGAAHDALATLLRLSDSLPQDQAGVRLYNNPALQKSLVRPERSCHWRKAF
jgi:hypothetical protein